MRYFFNLALTGGTTTPNTDGEECSLDEAKATAIQVAQDFAHNKTLPEIKGRYVSVTDDGGREVFRAPLL
jgi:hypothetical protein